MTDDLRAETLEALRGAMDAPGGRQAIRFVLNALGSIPAVGGVFPGVAAIWNEREQSVVNQLFAQWAALTETQVQEMSAVLKQMTAGPTRASFALLLGELFGNDIAEELLVRAPAHIPVVLNSMSVVELQPYVKKGWVSLHSTGATCSMGCGNKVGNHVEELKYPHGLGSGFVLQVEKV